MRAAQASNGRIVARSNARLSVFLTVLATSGCELPCGNGGSPGPGESCIAVMPEGNLPFTPVRAVPLSSGSVFLLGEDQWSIRKNGATVLVKDREWRSWTSSVVALEDGRVFVFSGADGPENDVVRDCVTESSFFSESGVEDVLPDPTPVIGAAYAATQLASGEVMVAGGFCGGLMQEESHRQVFAFDPQGLAWKSLAPMPARKKGHILVEVPTDRTVLALGAESYLGFDERTFEYSITDDEWTFRQAVPEPLVVPSAVWVSETELIVAGGFFNAQGRVRGWRYDVPSDSWSIETSLSSPYGYVVNQVVSRFDDARILQASVERGEPEAEKTFFIKLTQHGSESPDLVVELPLSAGEDSDVLDVVTDGQRIDAYLQDGRLVQARVTPMN